MRPTETSLTDENIIEAQIPNVTNLKEFKEKIILDTKRENAQVYLLKFYEAAIKKISEVVQFNVPGANLNLTVDMNIKNFMQNLNSAERSMLHQDLIKNDPKIQPFVNQMKMQAIISFDVTISESIIKAHKEIKVSEKEIE
ncbi:UNVERIFIED_CONTAM: hypothetical protein O8I53_10260 [Campylobacter lari]